jgi:hypothetical protein
MDGNSGLSLETGQRALLPAQRICGPSSLFVAHLVNLEIILAQRFAADGNRQICAAAYNAPSAEKAAMPPKVGRRKLYDSTLLVRLTAETLARIDAV